MPMKILYVVITLMTSLGYETSGKEQNLCRTRNGIQLPRDAFNLHTCISCYMYMLDFRMKFNARLNNSQIQEMAANVTSYEELLEVEGLLSTFRNQEAVEKWKECCRNADDCCVSMLGNKTEPEPGWCPRTWDGWLCWPDTPPNTTTEKLCPTYSISLMESCTESFATKNCTRSGSWKKYLDQGNEWTDYRECSPKKLIERRAYVRVVAYAASVIALVPALIIFLKFRSLQCHRIILHKNLFASLLLYCSTQIAFTVEYNLTLILNGRSEWDRNELTCKIIMILLQYFRQTNYMWMLCEGFYLHRQIVKVFAEENRMKMFYIIGWGFPAIPITIYYLVREDVDGDYCSTQESPTDWILHTPCLLSLVINAIFLMNIVIILITKMRAVHVDEPSQFRKAVRATLVLIPLFGVHLLLTIHRLGSVCSEMSKYYVYIGYLVEGLQGLLVAIIFCFNNSEVIAVLKRCWRNAYEKHNISQVQSTITSVVHSQTVL